MLDQRQMIGFCPHPLLDEVAMAVHILDWREPGKDFKVAYEVRLIGVSAVSRQHCPVDRYGITVDHRQRVLKSPDTAEEFWLHCDFSREQLDEPPFAEPHCPGNFSSSRPGLRASECVESNQYFAVVALTTRQLTNQPVFENAKPAEGGGTFGQPAVDLCTAGTAHIAEIDVTLSSVT